MYQDILGGVSDERGTRSGFGDKWGWYQSVYTVAGGDLTKFDEILEYTANKFMTFLEFKIDLAREEHKSIQNE